MKVHVKLQFCRDTYGIRLIRMGLLEVFYSLHRKDYKYLSIHPIAIHFLIFYLALWVGIEWGSNKEKYWN